MANRVMPLHYVTLKFRLQPLSKESRVPERVGQHCFLYGVESWIDGIDQRLAGLAAGEMLELLLEPEAAAMVAARLMQSDSLPGPEEQFRLALKILRVVQAEPREVIRALAATVKCCSHCSGC